MIQGTLSTFCSNNNWATNEWLRPAELDYIALNSDGNQFYAPKTMKIMFDTHNELIKIKYSVLTEVSSFLYNFSYKKAEKQLLLAEYLPGTVYYKRFTREPEVGDRVYCYDPVSGDVAYSTITAVNARTITLNNLNVINMIESATNALRFSVLKEEYIDNCVTISDNPIMFYKEADASDFAYDVAIRTSMVVGFSFLKTWGRAE